MPVVPLLSTDRLLTDNLAPNPIYRGLKPLRLRIQHLPRRPSYHHPFPHLSAHAVIVASHHLCPKPAFFTLVVLLHMFPGKARITLLCPFSVFSSQMLLGSGIQVPRCLPYIHWPTTLWAEFTLNLIIDIIPSAISSSSSFVLAGYAFCVLTPWCSCGVGSLECSLQRFPSHFHDPEPNTFFGLCLCSLSHHL